MLRCWDAEMTMRTVTTTSMREKLRLNEWREIVLSLSISICFLFSFVYLLMKSGVLLHLFFNSCTFFPFIFSSYFPSISLKKKQEKAMRKTKRKWFWFYFRFKRHHHHHFCSSLLYIFYFSLFSSSFFFCLIKFSYYLIVSWLYFLSIFALKYFFVLSIFLVCLQAILLYFLFCSRFWFENSYCSFPAPPSSFPCFHVPSSWSLIVVIFNIQLYLLIPSNLYNNPSRAPHDKLLTINVPFLKNVLIASLWSLKALKLSPSNTRIKILIKILLVILS